jgi:hypothetical protein
VKRVISFAFVLGLAVLAPAAHADNGDAMSARLSAEKPAAVEPGLYSAGEGHGFALLPYRGKYLLRFTDTAESFVLTLDAVSLGGRLLKYDTGATALRVPVWGGLTLYVPEAPGGLPATRQDDATLPSPPAISTAALQAALEDESSHFSYSGNLRLRFAVDAAVLANADARAFAFDTLANVQVGIERLLAGSPAARAALARRVETVRLVVAPKPALTLAGRELKVAFTPQDGFLGRASSHAMAHQLGKLLAVSTPE